MIVAILVVQAVALVLLGVLVAGLLRSHAEILRALHQLGVSLDDGEPAAVGGAVPTASAAGSGRVRMGPTRGAAGSVTPIGGGESTGEPAMDVTGVTARGSALHVAVVGTPRTTLLAFLTSGCVTCGNFWAELSNARFSLPAYVDRLVVVTRGVDRESPAEVLARAPRDRADVVVVMSSEAWSDYRVPVSPYFVLVDGASGRVAGEGAAGSWPQLESLLVRAAADSLPPPAPDHGVAFDSSPDSSPDLAAGPGAGGTRPGGQRERADEALARAGIDVGHASLYGRDDAVESAG
jgi:hypothetical protein